MLVTQQFSPLDKCERALRDVFQLGEKFYSQSSYEDKYLCGKDDGYFNDEVLGRISVLGSHRQTFLDIGLELFMRRRTGTLYVDPEIRWSMASFGPNDPVDTEAAARVVFEDANGKLVKNESYTYYDVKVFNPEAFATFLTTIKSFQLSKSVSREISLRSVNRCIGLAQTCASSDSPPDRHNKLSESMSELAAQNLKAADSGELLPANSTAEFITAWFRTTDDVAANLASTAAERSTATSQLRIVVPKLAALNLPLSAFFLRESPVFLREVDAAISSGCLEKYYEERSSRVMR